MGHAKQTQARLIDQRARRRATQKLVEMHQDEYDLLLVRYRTEATQEAARLGTHHAQPARLMPGRRLENQDVIERIDVARCPDCVSYHDAGHTCARCGSPAEAPAPMPRNNLDRAVQRMVARGRTDAQIAFDLGITEDAVISRRKYLYPDRRTG